MKERNRFPPGWNDARVQRLLDHYEAQSDIEAVAEDEAAYRSTTAIVMKIRSSLFRRSESSWRNAGQVARREANMACSRRRDGRLRAAADV
jgi:hypothetical protein